MSRLSDALSTLIARWTQENVPLLPSDDRGAVEEKLSKLSKPYAEDMVELYCRTGGMADGYFDDNHFALWSLDRVAKELNGAPADHIEFADFLIDSHRYALRKVDGEASAVFTTHYIDRTTPPYPVCTSLTSFFEQYAAASDENEAFRALNGWIEPQ
jgi:hypothetical protein